MSAEPRNWASVATPNIVYVGIAQRHEFDQIALPAQDIARVIPDRPVLVKTSQAADGFQVVFQHWYGPTAAAVAATQAANAALESMRKRNSVYRHSVPDNCGDLVEVPAP